MISSPEKSNRLRALDHQLIHIKARLERLRRTSYRISWLRIAIIAGGVLVSGVAYVSVGLWLSFICVAIVGLVFGIAVAYHRQIDNSIIRHQIWQQIKSAHIARAVLDWEHIPSTFGHQPQMDHPFEVDLNLVGRRSLYALLDTSVSYEGSQRLRSWLTARTPDPEQVLRRQDLVRELAPLSRFRDKLILHATIASGTRKTWEANQLQGWLEHNLAATSQRNLLVLFAAAAGLNAILFAANRLGLLPAWWQITFLLYLGSVWARSRTTAAAWDEAIAIEDALRQLGAVFRQLERYSYRDAPCLRRLCEPFLDSSCRPSAFLARVTRVLAAMGFRANPVTWFALNALVPWDLYFAYRLNQHKAEMAQHAPAWMDAWFELEALSSLANLGYLNPDYSFPEILVDNSSDHPFVFRARGLGHPLIPDEERVCNDFAVPVLGSVTIITGSNMTGKSVFLKTVGLNSALALAGGPVNANDLQAVPFRLFTSIGITDSVTDGISYFFAEVKRLRALLEELNREHPLPLLFFIDEIFRGTNNRERLIGSRAYVRALVEKHGIGFVATHDLELAKLADRLPQVENYHFRDHFVDGQMVFDYTLRPGPCPTTNALKIMQLEGLPVETTND